MTPVAEAQALGLRPDHRLSRLGSARSLPGRASPSHVESVMSSFNSQEKNRARSSRKKGIREAVGSRWISFVVELWNDTCCEVRRDHLILGARRRGARTPKPSWGPPETRALGQGTKERSAAARDFPSAGSRSFDLAASDNLWPRPKSHSQRVGLNSRGPKKLHQERSEEEHDIGDREGMRPAAPAGVIKSTADV